MTVKKKQTSKQTSKKKVDKESKQLVWIISIIGIIFAAFLITYYHSQIIDLFKGTESFEYSNINWTTEDWGENLTVYHGTFPKFLTSNVSYNLYMRIDPRENDVNTTGTFNMFSYTGVMLSVDENVYKMLG